MALIVVGGQSRKVGKTSVVVGLISALREYEWVAAKITQHGHEACSRNGGHCDCVSEDHTAAITEENDRSEKTDTSRFLVAGAVRALWVRTRPGCLTKAMPQLREVMAAARNVILESNSVLQFVQPNLYLFVLNRTAQDFKKSAQEYLPRVDAFLLQPGDEVAWQRVAVMGKPVFRVEPPKYVPEELVEFVREKLKTLDSGC